MRFDADALGLSPTGVPLLRDLIHERLGVYYDDERSNLLLDRLAPLVIERGFDSFVDYYYLLRYDEAAASEWGRVADAIAVAETYFWREADQIKVLTDVLVPQLVARIPGPLRIWSVPCASGEEPLSIAMAFDGAGWFAKAAIEITGSDASPSAIARARAGRYRERSFRALPPELHARYFSREGDTWRVDPGLHRRVAWTMANVMSQPEIETLATSHVIFCRNLFIYFSDATVKRVAGLLADLMPVPGYLFLGAAESLLRHTSRLQLEEVGGVFVYVKR